MSALPPPLAAIVPQIAAVADYEPFARERMSEAAWAYFSGGAGDELTLRENLAAFARLRLRNRVLADFSQAHTRCRLFGDDFDFPILLAPVARQGWLHPDAERASALAASAMRAGMVLSCQADVRLEDIARQASAPLWMQLYLQPGREDALALAQRAEAAGYRALVLTVDAAVNGPRNREQRAGPPERPLPPPVNLAGGGMPVASAVAPGQSLLETPQVRTAPTWRDVEWLRAQVRLPLLLKGIAGAEDARRALDAGVDGLIVSNHGGRVLDSQIATIDALPEVAAVAAGRVPLLLDGGIRRGTDVFKALALGADAVLVGRPCAYALAAAGAPGVAHVLHLLRVELEMAMVSCGCPTLADIDRACIA